MDHVVAKANGGTDDESNRVPACKVCNSAKGTLGLDDFRSSCISKAIDCISRLHWVIGEEETSRLRGEVFRLAGSGYG